MASSTNGEAVYTAYLDKSKRTSASILGWDPQSLREDLRKFGWTGGDVEDAITYWSSLPRAPPPGTQLGVNAVSHYLSNIKALLRPNRDDIESSFLSVEAWEGDTKIGKVMPFVGRRKEITTLLDALKLLFKWWMSVRTIPSSEWDESFKGKGFSFIICGAASGIGKSTFARMAFVEMVRRTKIHLAKGAALRNDPLIKLIFDCVEQLTLYRTTFVHTLDWETSSPQCSIAFRFLHAACKHMFLDKQMQFFPNFATSSPPPFGLTLPHVFKFVREVLGTPAQPVMIVYHLDEMNHLQLEQHHKNYTHDILAHMHASMIQNDVFLVPILTGTNAEELNRLKISSGFNISSINLGPLEMNYMRKAVVIFVQALARHVNKQVPEVIAKLRNASDMFEYEELEFAISDCGGNPQVLVILFGVLAGQKQLVQKAFVISDEQVEQLLQEIEGINSTTVKTIRDAVWHSVVSSHVLGSLAVGQELAEVICGFGLTGELVQRSTVLVNNITVGNAESSGSLYLLQVEGDTNPLNQRFRVVLPNLHYRSLQFAACCPALSLLKHWTTNPRDNELHDIEYIAFRVWWLKRKLAKASFRLSELFPSLTFHPTQDVELLFPSNFNIDTMGMNTKATFREQILKYRTWYNEMHFFLGPGKESFVDSWAVFYLASDPATHESPGTAFSLMVQSRQTIANGITIDCEEQLRMCEEAVQSQFHLLVISDGIIEAHESDHLHCVQGSDLNNFFGPVLGCLRNSTIRLLAGVEDSTEYYDEMKL